jgi:hypothetical protein
MGLRWGGTSEQFKTFVVYDDLSGWRGDGFAEERDGYLDADMGFQFVCHEESVDLSQEGRQEDCHGQHTGFDGTQNAHRRNEITKSFRFGWN